MPPKFNLNKLNIQTWKNGVKNVQCLSTIIQNVNVNLIYATIVASVELNANAVVTKNNIFF
jgi:hypothetical protein